MLSTLTSMLALAASVSAIQFTWPNITDVNGTPALDLSVPQTITWNSTAGDPTTITKIALVVPPNWNASTSGNPTSSIDIASNIQTSLDQYIMQPPSGLTVNATYQIWFYGPYNSSTTGVIAESSFFTALKISSSSASPTTTGGSGSGSGGSGGSGASPTGSAATTSATKKANGAGALKAFAGAGLISAVAVLFL